MACMEHECADCGHYDMDNRRWSRCPKCGSTRVTNWFDEPPEEHLDYDERDREEET